MNVISALISKIVTSSMTIMKIPIPTEAHIWMERRVLSLKSDMQRQLKQLLSVVGSP